MLARAIRRILPAPRETVCTMQGGYRMKLRPSSDPHERKLYERRTYEPAVLALMDQVLRPGDVMVDCGANLGLMTLHASKIVGPPPGMVIAIEPHPVMFERLTDHIAMNRCRNVLAFRTAAGAEPGEAMIYDVPSVNIGRSSLVRPSTGHETAGRVRVDKLDNLLKPFKVRFVKIDIEGYEAEALKGATETLAKRPVICMEVSTAVDHEGCHLAAHDILTARDFKPHRFAKGKGVKSALVPLQNQAVLLALKHENLVYLPPGEPIPQL